MSTSPTQAKKAPKIIGNPSSADFDMSIQSEEAKAYIRENWDGVPMDRPLPKSGKAAGKSKRKKGESDYDLAKKIVDELPGPLSWISGNFYLFSEGKGWEICDRTVEQRAHEKLSRNADLAILPIIRSQVAIPPMEETQDAPIYWERIGGRWDGKWQPLDLAKTEILYTDRIVDVVSGDDRETTGRVIWGPMISLPWTTDSGDAPPIEDVEKFMTERMPDKEIRRHMQEVLGCILQPHVPLRGQIVFWGPPGCGKTTVAMAVAHAPAGALGVAQQQEFDLVRNKWSRNQLVNKFANISDDSERVAHWIGFVKKYTSGTYTAEPKYGKPATVAATAKLISTCNEMQDVADASGAMVDRLMPFKLEMRVEGDWDMDMMSPRHWCRSDMRASMVEWLVQGLARVRARGRFDPPANWMAQKNEAVAEGDPIEGWLLDNIEPADASEYLKLSELVEKFPAQKNISQRALEMKIGTYLKRLFRSPNGRVRENGAQIRVFLGVRWIE